MVSLRRKASGELFRSSCLVPLIMIIGLFGSIFQSMVPHIPTSGPQLYAQESGEKQSSDLSRRYRRIYNELETIGEARENSSEAEELFRYIGTFADNAGILWDWQQISRREQFHSFGRNIRYTIAGEQESRMTIILPYVLPPGSDSNQSKEDSSTADSESLESLAAVLSVLESLDGSKPAANLELYFLGSRDEQKGIREYLSINRAVLPQAVIYLEAAVEQGNSVILENGDTGIVSPLWLVRHIQQLLENNGISGGLANSRTQLYRIGLARPSEIGRLLQSELNSIALRFQQSESKSYDPLARNLQFLHDLILTSGDSHIADNADITGLWDQHYLSFNIGSRQFLVNEMLYVQSVLGIILLLLLWLFIFRKRRRKYLKTLGRNFWNLPLLYSAMFAFIFMGSLMVSLVEQLRGIENLWRYLPIPLFLLKIITASFLFTVFFTLIRRFPLSKNGSFYSAAAILILAADVFIFGIININFAYYFLWALLWAFIFSVSRSRLLKSISALLSPLLIAISVVDIIRIDETLLIGELIASDAGINLLVAFILLPFMLMLIRLDFLFPHPVRGRKNFTLRYSALAMLLLLMVNLLSTFVLEPFPEQQPQQIIIRGENSREYDFRGEESDASDELLATSITAYSNARLGELDFTLAEQEFSLDTRNTSYRFPSADIPGRMSYTLESRSFLGRTSYSLRLDSGDTPAQSIRISLFTSEDTSPYDATLPYRFITGRGEIRFLNGINPPSPLLVEFTLPSRTRPRIEIQALFREPGTQFTRENGRWNVELQKFIQESIIISGDTEGGQERNAETEAP